MNKTNNNLFKIDIYEEKLSCNIYGCHEDSVVEIHIADGGYSSHSFRYCEKHFLEYQNSVNEEFKKFNEYLSLKKNQEEELKKKKEELFK